MNRFAWENARTVAEAAGSGSSLVADAMALPSELMDRVETTVLKAGGIDILDLLKERLLAPQRVMNLRELPGLDAVDEDAGGLRIGSLVTLSRLAADALVFRRYPALSAALCTTASPQIRNVATLGGNLLQRPRCWYFRSAEFHCLRKGGGHCFALTGENQYHAIFDNRVCAIVHPSSAATVLVALGASVELVDGAGAVRLVLLEDFFVPPDRDIQRENVLKPQEIVTAVRLPSPSPGTRMAYLKQGQKDSFDWPLAEVAVVLDLAADATCANAAIVLGAAAPVPHRAISAERVLIGKRIDDNLAREAGRCAVDGAAPLEKNAYKVPLFETLVRRAIQSAYG